MSEIVTLQSIAEQLTESGLVLAAIRRDVRGIRQGVSDIGRALDLADRRRNELLVEIDPDNIASKAVEHVGAEIERHASRLLGMLDRRFDAIEHKRRLLF